jgi:restriction system protein
VTDTGVAAYKQWSDPEASYKEAVRLYRVWKEKEGQKGAAQELAEPVADTDDAEKSSSITFEQAEEQSWGEIDAYLTAMDPYEFQKLVADLLKAMGYYPFWIAPPGKDGGIDIVAHPDPLGTRPPRIKVQVKRQQQCICREGLSAFLAHVSEEDAGLFVSIGGFTRDAEEFARSQERRKITLSELERLVDLGIAFYPKLDDLAREQLPSTPIYFLTPKGCGMGGDDRSSSGTIDITGSNLQCLAAAWRDGGVRDEHGQISRYLDGAVRGRTQFQGSVRAQGCIRLSRRREVDDVCRRGGDTPRVRSRVTSIRRQSSAHFQCQGNRAASCTH